MVSGLVYTRHRIWQKVVATYEDILKTFYSGVSIGA